MHLPVLPLVKGPSVDIGGVLLPLRRFDPSDDGSEDLTHTPGPLLPASRPDRQWKVLSELQTSANCKHDLITMIHPMSLCTKDSP